MALTNSNRQFQDAVTLYHDANYIGQIDTAQISNEVTAKLVNSNAAFGLGLVATTNANEAALPSVTGGRMIGVSTRKHSVSSVYNDANGVGYTENGGIAINNLGYIIAQVELPVVKGTNVFLRHTLNGATTLVGAFRSDADTANADEVTNVKFAESVTGTGLGKARIVIQELLV